jgi:nicotinamide-nucleotide amidase
MTDRDKQLARLSARVGSHLQKGRRMVAAAESCTGGWISKILTDTAGSSEWFAEGFVTYSNFSKKRRLGVKRALLERDGAVSESVARSMAGGALRRSQSKIAVAVTGIAGPGGAVEGKPVGTVWFAWAIRRGGRVHVVAEVRHFRGGRDLVRRKTVKVALEGILKR